MLTRKTPFRIELEQESDLRHCRECTHPRVQTVGSRMLAGSDAFSRLSSPSAKTRLSGQLLRLTWSLAGFETTGEGTLKLLVIVQAASAFLGSRGLRLLTDT